jgi:hypothetical protein
MNRIALNNKASRELNKLFSEKGVRWCELQLSKCNNFCLSYAHRHKRRWYYDKPDHLLWDHDQVAISCANCHEMIEKNKELTESTFLRVRGEEKI